MVLATSPLSVALIDSHRGRQASVEKLITSYFNPSIAVIVDIVVGAAEVITSADESADGNSWQLVLGSVAVVFRQIMLRPRLWTHSRARGERKRTKIPNEVSESCVFFPRVL